MKDEEAYMFQQYKMGKLDPKPGEPNRKRFLEKNLYKSLLNKAECHSESDSINYISKYMKSVLIFKKRK